MDADQQSRYATQFARVPHRIVTDGTLRCLWKGFPADPECARGAGSLLPPLMLHVWKPDPEVPGWTLAIPFPLRKFRALVGCDEKTARKRLRTWERLDLARVELEECSTGGDVVTVSLSLKLFPAGPREVPTEDYATVSGGIVWGGWWKMLDAADQHVYLATIPSTIRNPVAYRTRIADGMGPAYAAHDPDVMWNEEAVRDATDAVSVAELVRRAGPSKPQVKRSLRKLKAPIPHATTSNDEKVAFIRWGAIDEDDPRAPCWYTPDERLAAVLLPPEVVNTPAEMEQIRREVWSWSAAG